MKKKMTIFLAAAALAGTLAIGGTMAYLTDYDTVNNRFTVGKVEIDLEEPGWKPKDNEKLVPTQNIAKDPQITNTGKNDAFVYLEVSVPIRSVITANPDGSRKPKADTELFSFAADKEWTQVSKSRVGTNQVYTYCYNRVLSPGKNTTPLFQSMTFANVIEGQLEEEALDVPVRAYAIQTVHTGGDKQSVAEQAKEAYKKYIAQNQDQTGKVTQ